jgi:anti-sigma factor (TIGR02949 family)
MITCTDAVRQLWAYLDDTLPSQDREAVEEHLSLCRSCCGEAEFAKSLHRFLKSQQRDDVPPDVRARLEAAIGELEE